MAKCRVCDKPAIAIMVNKQVIGYKMYCWKHLHGTDDTPEKKEALKRANDEAWEKFQGG